MDFNGSGAHGCGIGTIYLGTGHGRPVRMNGGPSPYRCRGDAKYVFPLKKGLMIENGSVVCHGKNLYVVGS